MNGMDITPVAGLHDEDEGSVGAAEAWREVTVHDGELAWWACPEQVSGQF